MSEFLAFVSDMHIAPPSAGAERAQSPLDRPARRAAHLERALAEIQQRGPAAVLFGGDNTNQPADRPDYRDALLSFLRKMTTPWLMIPGNHDIGATVGWARLHDPAQMSQACRAYRKAFGPDWWARDCAGFRLIGVNSQISGSRLDAAAGQATWLREELARPNDLPKVVFFHTPPYLQTPEDRFDDGSEQMCLRPEARMPLLDILNATPPALLITGHAHRFWKRREPSWDWLGLPATALGLDEMGAVPSHRVPAGDDRIGWVALTRAGAGWRVEFHPLSLATRAEQEIPVSFPDA